MILAFDAETTGLPLWKSEMDDPRQPRLVQLGCIVADDQWGEIASLRLIVQPDGWEMPEEVVAIHGITQEMCIRHGLPIKAVLVPFIEMAKRCQIATAYNLDFDAWFIRSEIRRLGSDDKGIDRPGLRHIDPMQSAKTLLPYGQRKLSDLHMELLKWEYPQSHDGLADARACLRCLRVLVKRKLVEL